MNILSELKSYKWNSLFFKYLKIIFLTVFVPLLIICTISVSYFVTVADSRQSQSLNNTLEKTSYQLDLLAKHFTVVCRQIEDDNVFKQYLSDNTDITTVSSQEMTYIQNYLLRCQQIMTDNLHSIYFYSDTNKYVYSTKHSSSNINDFFDQAWYKDKNRNNNYNVVYSPSEYPHATKDVLSFVYKLHPDSTHSGTIVFNVDINEFLKAFIDIDSNFILYNEHSNILYSYNDLYLDSITAEQKSNNSYFDYKFDFLNYSLHMVKPRQTGISGVATIVLMTIVLLLCVLTAFIISIYLSSLLYTTINRIISNLHHVLEGKITMDDDFEELTIINKNILNIISKSKAFEKELSAKILELKNEQIQSMQYQINPHFLFNTLNTMNLVAMTTCENPSLSKMIILLADMLENIMDTTSTFGTIGSEISIAKKYIELLAITQSHRFEIAWDIPETLKNYKMPKLIIQPLIENAFEHGIKALPEDTSKNITIKAYDKNSIIEIEVFNNGPLIPSGKMKSLNNLLAETKQLPKKHIGLINTSMRIKLIYGDEYGCTIRNTDTGVVSSIRLPKIF